MVAGEKWTAIALDGSRVTIEGVDSGESPIWGFRAWYTSRRNGTQVLMSTRAGAHEHSPLPDAKILSEARGRDARLLAFGDPDNRKHPVTTFVYQSTHHELYTTQAGRNIPMDAFVDFLRPLEIADSPEGIFVSPKAGSGGTVQMHIGVTSLAEVAVLTAHFSSQALRELPAHAGRRVAGGELWKDDSDSRVILANESLVTALKPMNGVHDSRFIGLAESVRVTRFN